MKTVWQIRKKINKYSSDDPIICQGEKEEVLQVWEKGGYRNSATVGYLFGLYEVTYTLIDGTEVV